MEYNIDELIQEDFKSMLQKIRNSSIIEVDLHIYYDNRRYPNRREQKFMEFVDALKGNSSVTSLCVNNSMKL